MAARIPSTPDMVRPVSNAIAIHEVRIGRPPTVLLATSDDDLREALGDKLQVRGCHVIEAAHARTLHAAIRRCIDDPHGAPIDLFMVDATLDGCSPLHGIGYARQKGIDAPATLLVRVEDEHARLEAERMDLALCTRSVVLGAVDRLLLGGLRRVLHHRPSVAA